MVIRPWLPAAYWTVVPVTEATQPPVVKEVVESPTVPMVYDELGETMKSLEQRFQRLFGSSPEIPPRSVMKSVLQDRVGSLDMPPLTEIPPRPVPKLESKDRVVCIIFINRN